MARLLLIAAVIALLLWMARRAIASKAAGRRKRRMTGDDRAIGAPERLVCGACGHEFDPEPTGWICPRCGE